MARTRSYEGPIQSLSFRSALRDRLRSSSSFLHPRRARRLRGHLSMAAGARARVPCGSPLRMFRPSVRALTFQPSVFPIALALALAQPLARFAATFLPYVLRPLPARRCALVCGDLNSW